MTSSIPSLFVTACLMLAAPAQDGASKITISPNVGEVANYRSTQTQHRTIEAMGQDSTNEIVADLQVKVDEAASDGTVKVTATWLRIRGKVDVMGGGLEFDTTKPDSGDGHPMLDGFAEGCAAIIGVKTTLTFGPDGKLKDKKPLEELAGKLTGNVSGQAKMMLQGIFGAPVLEEQASVFGSFPAEPVAVGGTWSDKRERKGGGGLTMVTEFQTKLASVDGDYVTKVTGTVTSAPSKNETKDDEGDDDEHAEMMRNMMRAAVIKDGKVEGEARVARKDGLLVASQVTTSMGIHMPNPMGGDEPFIVTVKQVHKLERVAATGEGPKDARAVPKK